MAITKNKTSKTEILDSEDKTTNSQDEQNWLEIFSLFIHDIESPLASMKYVLKLLDEKKLDQSKPLHRKIITSSKIAIERAESIIYDIMAVAKSGVAKLPVFLENLNPIPIIEDSIKLSRGLAIENDINLIFDSACDECIVTADPKLLRRALDNLIFNAIRHTPSGGEIKVYTKVTKKSFYFHIKDSGNGLGDITSDELFAKFGQTKKRTQGLHRGVGLGLYFCKIAAEEMKGTIFADDHPDGGAVFSIRLQNIKEH